MSTKLSFLKRPYPLVSGIRKKLNWALSFSAYVFLLLYIFRPFGLGTIGLFSLLVHASAFSTITFSVMFLNLLLLPRLFSNFFLEERWSVGREIFVTLVHIFMIGLANYVFAHLVYGLAISVTNFVYLQFVTLAIALGPITVWTLLVENKLLKTHNRKAKLMNDSLEIPRESKVKLSKSVLINSQNKSENGTFIPDQIYFISSADNYIKIGLFDDSGLRYKMLRSSLKNVEVDLNSFSMFFRCHRAYIVNLDNVESVHGNARGLKLKLKKCPDEIPVSRSLNEEIGVRLKERLSM